MSPRTGPAPDFMKRIIRRIARWKPEVSAAVGASIVAACALALSIYEGWENRRYQRLSVKPVLAFNFVFDESGAGWFMLNDGLGPARLEWFEVTVDRVVKANWVEVAKALGIPNGSPYRFQVPSRKHLFRSGRSGDYRIFWFDKGEAAAILTKNVGRINLRVCYCSLYEECWFFERGMGEPRVSECRNSPPAVEFRVPPLGRDVTSTSPRG